MFRNEALDKGDWLDAILFEEGARRVLPRTFEDPAVTLDVEPVDMNGKPLPRVPSSLSTRRFAPSLTPGGPRKPLDKFNISDDWAYELKKNARQDLIRQVVGPAVIEHALPALQLHFQYFKPNHTTKDLRSYHRPAIRFPLNVDIRFSRVKVFKKKKAKAKDPSELMKSTKDISLKDTCPYVLLEYSEEYPMVLQNQGMASMIYNYYRKKDEKDSFVPKVCPTKVDWCVLLMPGQNR